MTLTTMHVCKLSGDSLTFRGQVVKRSKPYNLCLTTDATIQIPGLPELLQNLKDGLKVMQDELIENYLYLK